jgi:hypothetical protein
VRDAEPERVAALADEALARVDAARAALEGLLEAVQGLREALAPGPEPAATAQPPAPAAQPPGPAVSLDAARLVAIEMAVAGRSRGDVERHLRVAYGGPDTPAVLDDVFGSQGEQRDASSL